MVKKKPRKCLKNYAKWDINMSFKKLSAGAMQDVIWEQYFMGHHGQAKRCIKMLGKVHGEDIARKVEAQILDDELMCGRVTRF